MFAIAKGFGRAHNAWWKSLLPFLGHAYPLVYLIWLFLSTISTGQIFSKIFSTVRATVRGRPFLVKKTLSRALRSDPKPQNMSIFFLRKSKPLHNTTYKHHFNRNMSYPSWYMHIPRTQRSWIQNLLLALFLALLALFVAFFSQHYKCR